MYGDGKMPPIPLSEALVAVASGDVPLRAGDSQAETHWGNATDLIIVGSSSESISSATVRRD